MGGQLGNAMTGQRQLLRPSHAMDDSAELTLLQKRFRVTALGGGDPIVGFNLLASMACTLANLAPDDGTVVHPDGSPARLGTSLLVFGSGSAGRVVDEVITEVCRRQNNLISHLRSYFELLDAIRNKPGCGLPPEGPGPKGRAVNPIEETQSPYGDMFGGYIESWRKVLVKTPGQTIRQIAQQPKFLVSVGGRKDLESQLTRLLPGCPLVHLGLSHPGDLAQFSESASALLEGRLSLDDGRTVKGNVLVTDPMRVLMAAARNPDERTLWLGHLLWLTDGDYGPDAPNAETGGNPNAGARIEERFRAALGKVMAYRFNPPEKKPLVLMAGIREASARWSGFLREMEPRLPGICGAARNLPASLAFGLELMAAKPGVLSVSSVEAMARFLARRMTNAYIAILHAGELARRKDHITRIFSKLASGPADGRKISSDLKINAVDRDAALGWLEAARMVCQGRHGEWMLCEGARLSFTDCSLPAIEV